MSAVWAASAAQSGDLLVLLAIADFCNDEGIAFPSVATLAKKARLSPRQVKRTLSRLQRMGELKVLKRTGPNRVNKYRILLGDKLSPSEAAPVTLCHPHGDISGTPMVTPMSPNPITNLREEKKEEEGAVETVDSGDSGEVGKQHGNLGQVPEAVKRLVKEYIQAVDAGGNGLERISPSVKRIMEIAGRDVG